MKRNIGNSELVYYACNIFIWYVCIENDRLFHTDFSWQKYHDSNSKWPGHPCENSSTYLSSICWLIASKSKVLVAPPPWLIIALRFVCMKNIGMSFFFSFCCLVSSRLFAIDDITKWFVWPLQHKYTRLPTKQLASLQHSWIGNARQLDTVPCNLSNGVVVWC